MSLQELREAVRQTVQEHAGDKPEELDEDESLQLVRDHIENLVDRGDEDDGQS